MKKLICLLLLLSLTGCKDYKELNDLAIVTGISIDYIDDLYDINTELLINTDKTSIKVYNSKATSIEEAISQISKYSNRELFLSRIKTILITEEVIKENINFYDFFLRDSKGKIDYYIYVVKRDDISTILNLYKKDNGSFSYIEEILKNNQKNLSSSTPLKLTDYIYKSLEKGFNVVYPTLSLKENNNEKIIYLDNLITYNEKKQKTTFNETESIFYNMIINKTDKTLLTIPCDNNYFSLELQNIKTKYKWNNKIFNINMNLKGKIKNYKCKYNINDENTIIKLENITKKYVLNNMNNLVYKIKNNNNDFLGIGNYIYKHDNKYFKSIKNWEEYITNINIKTNSNIEIISIGEIHK